MGSLVSELVAFMGSLVSCCELVGSFSLGVDSLSMQRDLCAHQQTKKTI
jgi:hypothetical protein